jgi:nicotinamidase-related amidase|nr:cysteine hydrolase family protein [Candidatus Krumholzibacteria bacterium]
MRLGAFVLLVLLILGGSVAAQGTPPGRTALVIIDIQDFYFPGGAMPLVDADLAARRAGRVLQEFRKSGDLVVHVGHEAAQGAGFHAEVAPEPGERIFMKDEVNAFLNTGLGKFLEEERVTDLVLVGMQTHMCLEGAVRAASDLGFDCVVVQDACATRDLKYGNRTVAAPDVHLSTLTTLRSYAKVMDLDAWLAHH